MRTTALFNALENSGKLYRYSGSNPQSGKLTGRTQVATVAGADGITKWHSNNADGQLYAISVRQTDDCDVNTGAVTEIGQSAAALSQWTLIPTAPSGSFDALRRTLQR